MIFLYWLYIRYLSLLSLVQTRSFWCYL
jgi:hypothetical protein